MEARTVSFTEADPGFTATSYYDGDITDRVVVTGTVYTDRAGVNRLAYNVIDSQGFAAEEQIRTVYVVESGNSRLESLSFDDVSLQPLFTYQAAVAYDVHDVSVTASVYDEKATTTINGNALGQSGRQTVALQAGSSQIVIMVTAENGMVSIVKGVAPPGTNPTVIPNRAIRPPGDLPAAETRLHR